MTKNDVVIGDFYTHKNNRVFVVTDLANDDTVVVYVDTERKVWACAMTEFCLNFSKRV